jgi:GT2 family glycosyltransferase
VHGTDHGGGRLGVVVVAYNCSDLLPDTLGSTDWAALGATVVVVDNSSDAQHAAATRALCRQRGWDYHAPGGNLGFGGGCNVGAELAIAAGADVLLLLNPDAWIAAPDVRQLVAECRHDPAVAVAPVIRWPDGRPWAAGGLLDARRGRVVQRRSPQGEPDWLTGAALAMSVPLWRRAGGFDDGYFLYWEDVDLSARVREAGGRLQVLPDASAVHNAGATQGQGAKSPVYVYYNCRNRLRYAAAHVPMRQRWGWLLGTPGLAVAMAVRGGRTPAAVWAAVRGTARGLLVLPRPPAPAALGR